MRHETWEVKEKENKVVATTWLMKIIHVAAQWYGMLSAGQGIPSSL